MSEGRMCERHERYCPDGVCPYCEPGIEKPDPSGAEEQFLQECDRVYRKTEEMLEAKSLLDIAKEAEKRLPPLLPLIEDLIQRNKLLAKPTTMCTPHPGDHTPACYDEKRFTRCKCGEYMFDGLCASAGVTMEGIGRDRIHTPRECRPLDVLCKCGKGRCRVGSDGAIPQRMDDSGILHTPEKCEADAFVTKIVVPAPRMTLGGLAKAWEVFLKDWEALCLLKDLGYVEPPRKLTATEVMQQRYAAKPSKLTEMMQQHAAAHRDGKCEFLEDLPYGDPRTPNVDNVRSLVSLTPDEQHLVKAYRDAVDADMRSFRWEIPWDAKYRK